MKIIHLEKNQYDFIKTIYLEGIATGQATFQTEAYSWKDWDNGHLKHTRLVAVENDKIMGWAALSAVSDRCVYAGVAEVSVYIGAEYRGKGVGNSLMIELIRSSEKNQIWTLQAGIFPENTASLKLHEKHAFRVIGKREKIGKMNDTWRDTILLERRSKLVGI